ncbi:hypothetical protein KR018_010314, partial [Drosophila ironensis]
APGKCPLGVCEQMVFPSGLLVHLLHKHARDPHCTVAVVYDGQPLRLSFDPRTLQSGVPLCLGILLYGGINGRRRTEPGRRLVSFPNAGLLNERRRFQNHLAMALMVCKTTFYALLADKKLENDLAGLNTTTSGLYVCWVVSPVTTRRFHFTLTAFDRLYTQSRSVIRSVRQYTLSQNPSDFLPSESDYLLLREVEALTMLNSRPIIKGDHTRRSKYNRLVMPPCIQLELIIHDHAMRAGITGRTLEQLQDMYSNSPLLKMPRSKYNLYRGPSGKLSVGRKP